MKPKGGRGYKADYKTVSVRCPEPLKLTVHSIIKRWHAQEFQPQSNACDPSVMSDEDILNLMGRLGKEYGDRLPKSTEQQADELVDSLIEEWDEQNIPESIRLQVVARLNEFVFGEDYL